MNLSSTRVVFLLLTAFPADSWWFWGGKKRPKRIDCVVGNWEDWGPCDVTCGLGNKERTRKKTVVEKNGGVCNYTLIQAKDCYSGKCCVIK